MTPLIIVLITIGIIFIVISCFFMNKQDKKDPAILEDAILSTSIVKKKVEDTLTQVTDETIIKTEDELSKISNEKIIAVNDFSNMVLDKISNNHEEVVFLYQMLNEKEEEIKNLMKQVDGLAKQVETNDSAKKNGIEENSFSSSTTKDVENEIKSVSQNDMNMTKEDEVKDKKEKKVKISPKSIVTTSERTNTIQNRNDNILSMYKEGKNVVQIAKELGLGQGEVKLIIDLYRQ